MKPTIRECMIDDLVMLREISYRTYNETFKYWNTPSNMADYLEKAFNMSKMQDELLNDSSKFYFLYADEKLAGYLKLNEGLAQTDIKDSDSMEIERIYVLKEFHGKALGSVLMNKAIEIAKAREKKYLWIGVWENNDKAMKFYKRNGFYIIGQHSFFMGNDEQTDLIMRRDLEIN